MADTSSTSEQSISAARAQVIIEASRIEEAALFSSKRHFEAMKLWSWWHWFLGIPLVILSAAVSADSGVRQVIDEIVPVTKFIPLAVLILSALATFINPQRRVAAHHSAGNAYDALLNEVRIFRTVECNSEPLDAIVTAHLKAYSQRKDRLNESSPGTPLLAYWLAKWAIWRGQADYAIDKTRKTPR